MHTTIQIASLASVTFAVTAFAWLARIYCLRLAGHPARGEAIREIPDGSVAAEQASPASTLRPAELAYLLRGGDMSHALIVLCFDLMHRAVKANQSADGGLSLAPYELRVWGNVKDIARKWMDDRVGSILPDPRTQSAHELVRRVSGLYAFTVKTVRPFLAEVMADPRNLKRYFQPAGMLRLLADLGSAGYKESVQRELQAELLERGLIADDAYRSKGSRWLVVAGCLGMLFLLAAAASSGSLAWAVSAWLLCGFSALGLRLVAALGDIVPLYRELCDVVDHVRRESWRLTLLRILLRAAGAVFYLAGAAVFVVSLALTVAVQVFVFQISPAVSAAAAIMLTLGWLVCLQMLVDSWRLSLALQPSLLAADAIKRERERLSGVSPFETFKALLASPTYDPLFSELLALYGIETLWLLV